MFRIVGEFQGEKEIIDEFDSREEAEKMLMEYRLAFGCGWILGIREVR